MALAVIGVMGGGAKAAVTSLESGVRGSEKMTGERIVDVPFCKGSAEAGGKISQLTAARTAQS